MIKKLALFLGPLCFLILYNLPFVMLTAEADAVVAVAAWMIIWWVTESVSISVTALIPLVIFPLVGSADMKGVAQSYGSPIVFLFFGGFVMALALEKVNLHKRIALKIVGWTGTSPDKVILGFMLATAFLSMWISNTATTVVMLPIAYSVIQLIIKDADGFTANDKNFTLSLMLAIAFSANVGGIATLIGTPPNTVLAGFMESEYQIELSFFKWILFGLPFALIMLFFIYLVLVKWIYPNNLKAIDRSEDVIQSELDKLGSIKAEERFVLIIFCITIFLWMFKAWVNGWFPQIHLSDTGISLLGAFCMFVLPHRGRFTLDWADTTRLPWGILILFGGGLALASSLSAVGLIQMIGDAVSQYNGLPAVLIGAMIITIMLFTTELMSNVALVAIFAPVVAGIAIGMNAPSILHYLIPVTMASSCAFMLPMATPPNAIVFASGHIEVHQMARVGVFLNVIAVILLIILSQVYIPLLF